MEPGSVADDNDIGGSDQPVHSASIDEQVASIQGLLRGGLEKCRKELTESQTRDEERDKRRVEKSEQYAALRESLETAKESLERRRSEQQEDKTVDVAETLLRIIEENRREQLGRIEAFVNESRILAKEHHDELLAAIGSKGLGSEGR